MASFIENAIRAVVRKGVMALADFNRARMRPGPHPFLTGLHAPMTRELDIAELAVDGTLPAGLDGRYFRIGPNDIRPDPRGHHWFSGDGMVHGLRLEGGRARWYRNRWIRSRRVAEAMAVPPSPGPRHGRFDTVNTAFVQHAGALRALVEAGSTPVRLAPDLASQAYDDFDGTLHGPFAAHPHLDPAPGELHAIAYLATEPDHVVHVVVDAQGHVARELKIPIPHGPMIHDCAFTARFVLVLDLPVTFSMRTFVGGHSFPYRWNPKHAARLGLLPRAGGVDDMVWIPLDPCFVFHTVNAYDTDDGLVVLDAVVYDRMFDGPPTGPEENRSRLERWIVDPVGRSVRRSVLHDRPQEFPRIDDRRAGRPHRFAWTLGLPEVRTAALVDAGHLFKHDLEAGRTWRHDFGPGKAAGEFVFVPRDEDAGEDEGWLVGYVIDVATDTTDFVVLDARDFESAPLARVRLPHRIPPGFHGAWVRDDAGAG